MDNKKTDAAPKPQPQAPNRKDRLAEALRANLRRRRAANAPAAEQE